jgi:transketolase
MENRVRQGGYVLAEEANPVAVIVATGSETSLAIEAHKALAAEGIATRVVAMPCTNVFDRQPLAYQYSVLPLNLPAVAVEAAHADFWRKYVGRTGAVVGIASFGESAPAKDLYEHFGITVGKVVEAVKGLLA